MLTRLLIPFAAILAAIALSFGCASVAHADAPHASCAHHVVQYEDDPCWSWSSMGNSQRGDVYLRDLRRPIVPTRCGFARLWRTHQIDWSRTPHMRGDWHALKVCPRIGDE